MTYNQDLINQAHQICQNFLRERSFDQMDMMDRLLLANVPVDLAKEVVSSYEVNEKDEKRERGRKYLKQGFVLLLVAILLIIGIHIFTGRVYLLTSIIMVVPGLLYLVTGIWEIIDSIN